MEGTYVCPKCRSTKLVKFGFRWAKASANKYKIKRQQYICNSCGKITISPIYSQLRDTKGRFITMPSIITSSINSDNSHTG